MYNSPKFADWLEFYEAGDSVFVTAAVIQGYNGGYLEVEVYFPSEAIEDINELINEPETVPEGATTQCIVAGGALVRSLWKLGGRVAIMGVRTYMGDPTAVWGVLGSLVVSLGAFILWLCECHDQCAEIAPPFEPARSFRGYRGQPPPLGPPPRYTWGIA